jgi:hypothetical protein
MCPPVAGLKTSRPHWAFMYAIMTAGAGSFWSISFFLQQTLLLHLTRHHS